MIFLPLEIKYRFRHLVAEVLCRQDGGPPGRDLIRVISRGDLRRERAVEPSEFQSFAVTMSRTGRNFRAEGQLPPRVGEEWGGAKSRQINRSLIRWKNAIRKLPPEFNGLRRSRRFYLIPFPNCLFHFFRWLRPPPSLPPAAAAAAPDFRFRRGWKTGKIDFGSAFTSFVRNFPLDLLSTKRNQQIILRD